VIAEKAQNDRKKKLVDCESVSKNEWGANVQKKSKSKSRVR